MRGKKADEVLIEEARSGNKQAMEELLLRYVGVVRSEARRFFLDGGETEDLIQEGMIGLYKAIRDFQKEKEVSFQYFAELCINRQMYSAVKGSNTKKNQPLNNYISIDSMRRAEEQEVPMEHFLGITSEKNRNPEQLVIDKESANVIEYTLVGHLSKMEREVLFYYMKDYNYNQIAAAVGKEVKAVDNAIQRIKKKLSQVLHELDG